MKKGALIIILILSIVIYIGCTSKDHTDNELYKFQINNNNPGETDDFIIHKEILTVKDVEAIYYEDKKDIEYKISKDYVYSDDYSLLDTKYTSDVTVYVYNSDGELKEERPMNKEEMEEEGKEEIEYYISRFDETIEYIKDPQNTIEGEGKQTVNNDGQVIKEEIETEDGYKNVYRYEYDKEGRMIKKHFEPEEGGWNATLTFKYDENDRVVEAHWSGLIMGRSKTFFKYNENGLLVEIRKESFSDTMDASYYTINFQYIEKLN
jgi:YD repeat-containing protein